ncbi:ubiquitin carboxyl-terminal hydrolase 45-like isoform X2 [Dysidea avara]
MVNLGNTCYLSAVLQCLNQTIEVFKLLHDAAHPLNLDLILTDSSVSPEHRNKRVTVDRRMGSVGKALYEFFNEINSNESRTVFKPSTVLSTIRQCNKMYQGRHPQDSHEVFRTILDCIRNEELEEIKQAICKSFGVTMKSVKQKDEETQKDINAYLRQAQKHCKLVSGVFGGKFVNIIICRECNSVIAIEEDFFDLSVPLKRVENTPNCYSHTFEFSSDIGATVGTSKNDVDAFKEQHKTIQSSGVSIPDCSPTLSTDTEQKHSVSCSELTDLVVQSSTVDMPNAPSMTTKPADEDHSNVTMENEAMHQHQSNQPTEISVPPEVNSTCDSEKLVSGSLAVVSGANVDVNDDYIFDAAIAAGEGAKFTTDEKLLQLHLKNEKLPYRVSRCDVETDLEAGLQAYFELDVLDENNKFMCDVCTALGVDEQGYTSNPVVLREVSKQLSIASLPEILVIHMKRFNFGQQKSSKIISFPLILNMAPYCTNICLEEFADSRKRILYGLYGVVEHCGKSLSGGHYVAYIRRRNKKLAERLSKQSSGLIYDEDEAKRGDWLFVDDRQVKKLPSGFAEIKCQAYMLFYERLPMITP